MLLGMMCCIMPEQLSHLFSRSGLRSLHRAVSPVGQGQRWQHGRLGLGLGLLGDGPLPLGRGGRVRESPEGLAHPLDLLWAGAGLVRGLQSTDETVGNEVCTQLFNTAMLPALPHLPCHTQGVSRCGN